MEVDFSFIHQILSIKTYNGDILIKEYNYPKDEVNDSAEIYNLT